VIARPGLLLLLVVIVLLGGTRADAAIPAHSVEIQIPGIAQPVRLAPVDADAFQRRLSALPPYAGPLPSGEAITVTTDYWDFAVGTGVGGPPTDAPAAYFQADGVVGLRQIDRDAYFVLDHRQRAMLNRYIRLLRTGSLPSSTPGAFQVLVAAAPAETIGIELPGGPLSSDTAQAVWRSLADHAAPVTFANPAVPPAGQNGYWIIFTTAEGRALQYFFEPESQRLTDFLGTETYTVRNIPPGTIGVPRQIEQQDPAGSLLWWPVMLGGGAGLLVAAVWLRNRRP
jgi:hypothetical protein